MPVAPIVPGTHGGAQYAIAGSNCRPFTQCVVSPPTSAPGGAPPAVPPPAPPVPPTPLCPVASVPVPPAAGPPAAVRPDPFAAATCWAPDLPALDGTKPMISNCNTANATSGA